MTHAEVATLLGVDEKQVDDLVRGCSLRLRRNAAGTGFAMSEVEKYRKRSLAGLITLAEAARMLGISKQNFRMTWVLTARLKIAETEVLGKEKCYLLRRRDVEAIAEFQAATVTAIEAAKELRVNVWNVDDWMRIEGLRAVSGPKVDGLRRKRYLRTDINYLLERKAKQIRSLGGKHSERSLGLTTQFRLLPRI